MSQNLSKFLSFFLSFCLIFEQSVFAQTIDLSHYFVRNPAQAILQSDKFRPLHLRYISYDNQKNDFKLLVDKGDNKKEDLDNPTYIEENTQTLLKYFFIGLSLPNEKFWVNLRPDSPDNILDPDLEKTDIGRIFLEADLQLKKDTASFTSPQNPEGKAYWDKLYKRAGELFGTENITIPTITRPWIVPNEIIIREAPDNAYIYKATLKVMLEEDYLRGTKDEGRGTRINYSFNDPRLKELNEYSTQLIKETIIPKLTYEINTSKRYAPLRQVYYSLILAQWFKQKYGSVRSARASGTSAPVNSYIDLIDSGNLANLASREPYDKQMYFQQYQKSFKDGEYNLQEPVYTPMGQSIRRYMSGGIVVDSISKVISQGMVSSSLELPETLIEKNISAFMSINYNVTIIKPETASSAVGNLPTNDSLAEKGIEAYNRLISSLPKDLAKGLLGNRRLLRVYTGVCPEAITLSPSATGKSVIDAIESNENFTVILYKDIFHVLNIEAVANVITTNQKYFPSGIITKDREETLKNTKSWIKNHPEEYMPGSLSKERRIRYGLLSGFPVEAVVNFVLYWEAIKKINGEENFNSLDKKILKIFFYPPIFLISFKALHIVKKIVKNILDKSKVLTEKEKTLLMNQFAVYIAGAGFMGFEASDQEWANALTEIHRKAIKRIRIWRPVRSKDDPGLCLTPDSLIYLADGTQKPLIELSARRPARNPLSTYEVKRREVKQEEKEGDMVLSLNEATGRLEPHRVLALLDMGVKPVYRLTTASGKSLKTTLTHPYLTKNGWRKLKEIKAGEEIVCLADRQAVAKSKVSRSMFPVAFAQTEHSDILYDKIVSIEPLRPMQVYDIEVEATHNFVAQGIVAHNTYTQEKPETSNQKLEVGRMTGLPAEEEKGGIAFNALPIQTESVASSALGVLSGGRAFNGDLDAEWAQIQAVFNAGIRPSIQRISEYTAAAVASPLAEDKIDQVRVMLADILRRDEEDEKIRISEPGLKKLLSDLESDTDFENKSIKI